MRLAPRIGYWGLIAVVTYFSGNVVAQSLTRRFQRSRPPFVIGFSAITVAIGALVLVEVLAVNWLVLGSRPLNLQDLVGLAANVLAVGVVVAGIVVYFSNATTDATPPMPQAAKPEPPRILQRLPLEKRGRLISISVQDHYVEVVTSAGSALILLRLTDAITEAPPVAGLQVHRSHWIATREVKSARRDGAKAVLTMSDGRDIPVSRTYVQAVKEAGLLPG